MDAYAEGRRAYNDGLPKSANPYKGQRNEVEWNAGWREGQIVDRERLKEKAA